MTTAALSITPVQQWLDDNGVPMAGAKLYTYEAGTNNPKATYTDYDSGIAQTNPIVADAAGRMQIWLVGFYKMVLKDQLDNLIWTVDNVGASGSSSVSVVQTTIGTTNSLRALPAGTSGQTVVTLGYRTVSDGAGGTFYWNASATGGDNGAVVDGNTTYGTGRWMRVMEPDINPIYWGAYGSGIVNDKSFFDAAITYARSVGKSLRLTRGTYYISATTDLDILMVFEPGAKLYWDNFAPVMQPVIEDSDQTQHFNCGTVTTYVPEFQAGMEVNPVWFGAVEGGTVDADIAISQAIASVSTNGGVVKINKGTWLCSESLVPMPNVTVIGQGVESILKCKTAFSGDYLFTSSGVITDNFVIKNLYLKGDSTQTLGAIVIYGSENIVEDVTMEDFKKKTIEVGLAPTTEFTNNNVIRNNVFTNSQGIEVLNTDYLVIEGNTINGDSATTNTGILLSSSWTGIKEVQVIGNTLHNCPIAISNASGAIKLDSPIIKDNIIDGNPIQGLVMSGQYSPIGKVTISENVIKLTESGSQSIYLQATSDGADCYTVTNNVISPASGADYGIYTRDLSKPILLDGNAIFMASDGTGFKESDVTSATYGSNLVVGAGDFYDVSRPRYCTLGTGFKSQIDGDTTSNNLIIEKRLLPVMGTDASVATGVTLSLPVGGNSFHISGHDQTVSLLSSTGWYPGATVNLVFDGTNVVTHNTTASGANYPLILAGGNSIYTKANETLTLLYDSSSRWLETGRTSSTAVAPDGTCVARFDIISGEEQFDTASDRDATVYYKIETPENPAFPTFVTLTIERKYATSPSVVSGIFSTTNAPLPVAIRAVGNGITIPIQVFMYNESHPGAIRILTDGNFDFGCQLTSDIPSTGIGTKYDYVSWNVQGNKGWDSFVIRYPLY